MVIPWAARSLALCLTERSEDALDNSMREHCAGSRAGAAAGSSPFATTLLTQFVLEIE
jgi:hypothetical protein